MTRLAILATHPVQYHAPVFRVLAERPGIELKAFYGWRGHAQGERDPDFRRDFAWDVPLLEGYEYEFLANRSPRPGSSTYRGIDLPGAEGRITAWRPDALLVYGWRWKAHLAAMRRFHGRVPVLFRGDSTQLDEPTGMRRYLRRLALRWVYSHVDMALAVGTHNREYFLAHGLPPRQVGFAPHAVENERFGAGGKRADAEAESWRETLGIPSGAVVVLFAGKLEPKKEPDRLLAAFARSGQSDLHLVFAGSGPLEAALQRDKPARIHFLGFQNQSRMPLVYRLGDCLILPSSHHETWGLAVNEAMASGRAVAVSDRVGCAPDLVVPDRTGWVFPSGDTVALERVLQEIHARGRDDLRAMGSRGREHIADWDVSRQADCIEHELARALEASA